MAWGEVLFKDIFSEFGDVAFEDAVFDNNRFGIDVTIETMDSRVTHLSLSNTTSSNTTSPNSRIFLKGAERAQPSETTWRAYAGSL